MDVAPENRLQMSSCLEVHDTTKPSIPMTQEVLGGHDPTQKCIVMGEIPFG